MDAKIVPVNMASVCCSSESYTMVKEKLLLCNGALLFVMIMPLKIIFQCLSHTKYLNP
jgi:hypothetical protein